MAQLLQHCPSYWRDTRGIFTAEEIAQQPAVWRALALSMRECGQQLEQFLGDWLSDPLRRVVLTGAGSSAYVAEIVADSINAAWPAEVRAVASTSLLTHPYLYVDRNRPTLLVSFARSGNSPESQACVELFRAMLKQSRFLNITCNRSGLLATANADRGDTFNLILPSETCDRGFAMTSSFTTMLLAALAALGGGEPEHRWGAIELAASLAESLLNEPALDLHALGCSEFERIVYLGSGPLEGLAKESALKILELTAGRVIAMSNTSMGFRHGPKAALNDGTLVVQFESNDPLSRKYDASLIDELLRDDVAGKVVVFKPDMLGLTATVPALSDAWLAPVYTVIAQQLALHKSAALGLTPDNPFADGTVNRVVQGVIIYPHDRV